MIREKLIEKGIGGETDFRWRSHEISRVESVLCCLPGRNTLISLVWLTY